MRFRSSSVIACTKNDFLLQLEEKDAEVFINAVGLISLDSTDLPNEYSHLGATSSHPNEKKEKHFYPHKTSFAQKKVAQAKSARTLILYLIGKILYYTYFSELRV